jgi:hypothetical protein
MVGDGPDMVYFILPKCESWTDRQQPSFLSMLSVHQRFPRQSQCTQPHQQYHAEFTGFDTTQRAARSSPLQVYGPDTAKRHSHASMLRLCCDPRLFITQIVM